MKSLRERFDYIIVDTPPASLVSDATLLQQHVDVTLIVLRQGYTSSDVYKELAQWSVKNPGATTYLILNDFGKSKRYQSDYKYGFSSQVYYGSERHFSNRITQAKNVPDVD